MLKLNNISKAFKSGHGLVQALCDVSFTFPETGLVSIVGKSGSGKTTLLNILAGLSSPSSGDYYIDNLDSKNLSKRDWDFLRKEYFSFIFQDKNLIDKRTVFENLQLVLLGKDNIDDSINKVLSLFDISSLKNTIVADLSGGEKQRVAIARAYLKQSKVILADEPSASLDEANTTIVFETLKKASKEKLVILVTHDVEFAHKYSDSIINISYGKISPNKETNQNNKISNTISLDNGGKPSLKNLLFKRKMLFGKQKFTKVFSCILLSLVSSVLCLSGYYTLFDRDEYEARINKSNAIHSIIANEDDYYGRIGQMKNVDDIKTEKYPSVSFYPCYADNGLTCYSLFYEYPQSMIDGRDSFFDRIVVDNSIGDYLIVPTDYVLDQLMAYRIISFTSYEESIGQPFNILGKTFVIDNFVKTNYKMHIDDFDYEEKIPVFNLTKMNQTSFDYLSSLQKYNRELRDSRDPARYPFDYKMMSSEYLVGKEECDFGVTQLESDNEIVITTYAYCLLENIGMSSMEPNELYEMMESKVGTSVHISMKDDKTSVDADFIIKGVIFTYYFDDNNAIYFKKSYIDSLEYNASPRKISSYSIVWGNSYDSTNLVRFLRHHNYRIVSDVSFDVSADIGYVTSTAVFFNILSAFFSVLLLTTLLFFNANIIKRNKRNIGIAHSLGINHKEITAMLLIENAFDICVALAVSLVTGAVFTAVTNCLAMNKGFANYALFAFNPLIHLGVFGITLVISFLLTLFIHSRVRKIEVSSLLKN